MSPQRIQPHDLNSFSPVKTSAPLALRPGDAWDTSQNTMEKVSCLQRIKEKKNKTKNKLEGIQTKCEMSATATLCIVGTEFLATFRPSDLQRLSGMWQAARRRLKTKPWGGNWPRVTTRMTRLTLTTASAQRNMNGLPMLPGLVHHSFDHTRHLST